MNDLNENHDENIENDAPVDAVETTDAQDPVDHADVVEQLDAEHPTVEQAEAMFADNAGLASVLTDKGNLSRDGILTPVAHGA